MPTALLDRVVRTEALHALIGLIGGLVVILVGAYMVAAGFTNPESSVIKLGDFELTTVFPGLVVAAMGFLTIWVTRPKVE